MYKLELRKEAAQEWRFIMARQLVIGGFYRHFKDKLYQVIGIAYHSETKEKMVVYQALYGDFSLYVRPFDMFMSEVDHVKYPDVVQKYRFEQVFPEKFEVSVKAEDVKELQNSQKTESSDDIKEESTEQINPVLEAFLDAETYVKKLEVMQENSGTITDKMIDAMAASMDIEVEQADIATRIKSLKNCINAHAKYECTRLR